MPPMNTLQDESDLERLLVLLSEQQNVSSPDSGIRRARLHEFLASRFATVEHDLAIVA